MEIIGHLDWYPRHDQPEALRAIRDLVNTLSVPVEEYDYRELGEVRFTLSLPITHPGYARLVEIRDQYSVRHFLRMSAKYTKQEVEQAPLLHLASTTRISGWTAEDSGTLIHHVKCPKCRLSYHVQEGPLYLRGVKKIQGARWGHLTPGGDFFLVSDELAKQLQEWALTGFSIGEVFSAKGAHLPVKQVIPTWVLPALAPSTPFFPNDNICSECLRRGTYPIALHYRRADLGEIRDIGFAPTYYSMNFFAQGRLIISQRLHRLMKAAGVKGFVVEPVFVVDH